MSAHKIKYSKEVVFEKLEVRIKKGTSIAQNGYELIKKNSQYNLSRSFVDDFKTHYDQWYEVSFSVLNDIFESDIYAHKFSQQESTSRKLVNSDWQPDIQYYLTHDLMPKINYLKILKNNIDDYVKIESETKNPDRVFVDLNRIGELREIKNIKYDLTRLIKLCDELNIAAANDCNLSIAMLTRTIINHVPPIFNYNKFSEVANNYNGGKSFKDLMQRLENNSRKIADIHLHKKIDANEVLPNNTQINFASELDVLLSEIIKVLKNKTN